MKYFIKNNFTNIEFKTIVLTLIFVFFSISAFAQRGVRIGYIDTEYILEILLNIKTPKVNLKLKFNNGKQMLNNALQN